MLLSSGDNFPHLIQKRRSQLGFVTDLLNYPLILNGDNFDLVKIIKFIVKRKSVSLLFCHTTYTHMCEIQGITPASAEMVISSKKNARRQRLRWRINTANVEVSNVCRNFVGRVGHATKFCDAHTGSCHSKCRGLC